MKKLEGYLRSRGNYFTYNNKSILEKCKNRILENSIKRLDSRSRLLLDNIEHVLVNWKSLFNVALIKFFRYLVIIYSLFNFIGCKKFLDEKSNKKLATPTSIEDLQALLDNQAVMNNAASLFGEVSADNYFLTNEIFSSLADFNRQAYLWGRNSIGDFPNDWSKIYDAVYYSNIVLENIDKVKINDSHDAINNAVGSAFFFRAFYFLSAVTTFCKAYDPQTSLTDLGISLRLSSDFNIKSERADVKKSYDQILEDLYNSVKYLSNEPTHALRPSKPAAYALLARTYLAMRNYDSSYKYSNLCLEKRGELLDYNELPISTTRPFTPYNIEVIFEASTRVYTYLGITTLNAVVDSNLFKSYSDADLRKIAYFLDGSRFGLPGYVFKGNYTGTSAAHFSGIATDEIYLMRAESSAKLGLIDEAMKDLNSVLIKRWELGKFFPLTASNQNEAISIIRKERRKELCFRGLRWLDIKRCNKENEEIILKRKIQDNFFELKPNDNRYALPLPNDVILMSGMLQNPY